MLRGPQEPRPWLGFPQVSFRPCWSGAQLRQLNGPLSILCTFQLEAQRCETESIQQFCCGFTGSRTFVYLQNRILFLSCYSFFFFNIVHFLVFILNVVTITMALMVAEMLMKL